MSFIFSIFLIYYLIQNINGAKKEIYIENQFNNTNKENNIYFLNQNSNDNNKNIRKLQSSPQKLRIYIYFKDLQIYFNRFYRGEFPIVNNSIYKAKETLENLIIVKIPTDFINISECKDTLELNQVILEDNYNEKIYADLAIFIREKGGDEGLDINTIFSKVYIIKRNNDYRTIVGLISFNFDYYNRVRYNNYKSEILNLEFLHAFTHLLGFDKESLENKGFITEINFNRIIGNQLYINMQLTVLK